MVALADGLAASSAVTVRRWAPRAMWSQSRALCSSSLACQLVRSGNHVAYVPVSTVPRYSVLTEVLLSVSCDSLEDLRLSEYSTGTEKGKCFLRCVHSVYEYTGIPAGSQVPTVSRRRCAMLPLHDGAAAAGAAGAARLGGVVARARSTAELKM